MRLKKWMLLGLLLCSSAWAQVASLSKTSLNFGNVPLAATSTQSVVLTNTGSATLTISSMVFTGLYAPAFSQTNNCGGSVGAGLNCTINITFTPLSASAGTASLTISDNAPGTPHHVAVAGTGVHSVMLAWTASPTSGVTGYILYRGTSPNGEGSTPLTSTIPGTSYTDLTVQSNTTYYYVVVAVGADGSTKSDNSNEASVKTPRRRIVVVTSS